MELTDWLEISIYPGWTIKLEETSDKDVMKEVVCHDAMPGVNTHLHE